MAPAGATGKPVKGSGLKPVVPVFPLTYQQRKGTNKQASKTVASSKLSSVASPPQPQPVKARLEVVEKGTNRDPAAEMNGDKEVKKPEHIQASTPPIQPEAQTPVTGVWPSPPSKPNATGTVHPPVLSIFASLSNPDFFLEPTWRLYLSARRRSVSFPLRSLQAGKRGHFVCPPLIWRIVANLFLTIACLLQARRNLPPLPRS